MNYQISASIIVSALFIVLVLYVMYKVLIKKERPKSYYTPFDYITGQSDKEFHQEEEKEQSDDVER